MPGMQFYGTAPTRRSQLAQAMAGGMKGFTAERERREEKKVKLETIDYTKKRDAANMVISVAKTLRPGAAEDFINKPEIKALFADLDWPLPTALHEEVDFKEAAQNAVMKGEPLPGLTMDETKKAAGTYIAPPKPPKITAADIKAAPWKWGDIIPWVESPKEEMERLRKEQFRGGRVRGGGRTDPLGAR